MKWNNFSDKLFRCIGIGHFQLKDYTVYYSGHGKQTRNDIAFTVMKATARQYLGTMQCDGIISVRLFGQHFNMKIIQVYFPTTNANEELGTNWHGENLSIED